jgi:hypothetical protein
MPKTKLRFPGGGGSLSRYHAWHGYQLSNFFNNVTPKGAGVQATRSAGPFCFRRYATKPTPAKPKIIITQVEGSGTAEVSAYAVVKSETTHDPSVGTVSIIALKGLVEMKPQNCV